MPDYRSRFRKNNTRPYFCCFCGEECVEGVKYDVHHKTHNRKNNRVRNLRAAHKWCHVSYHKQVPYLYWFDKFKIYWFDKLPKWVEIEPNSARAERWSRLQFNWRDPERLRQYGQPVPTLEDLERTFKFKAVDTSSEL